MVSVSGSGTPLRSRRPWAHLKLSLARQCGPDWRRSLQQSSSHGHGTTRLSGSSIGRAECGPIFAFKENPPTAAGRVQDMSPSLTALARILPVAEVKRCRRLATNGYRCISSGCAAAILCETGKAMVRLGLLRAGFSCMGQLALEETLSGAAAKWLVQILARTQPLSEEQQLRVHRPPDEEASEVDACLPPLGEEFENGPHFCRGSESLIVEIWPQLRRLGWRQPVRRWLSRHKTLRRKKVLEQTTTTHPTREWSGM